MKVYGNSDGDGFALLCTAVAGLFVVGGLGLTLLGGWVLPVGLLAIGCTAMWMLRGVERWSLQKDSAPVGARAAATRVTFTVPAQTDEAPVAPKPAWASPVGHDAYLPAHVDAPKPAIETNTPVA